MRKRFFTFMAVASLALLTLAGCSNTNIDTAKIRATMASLDAGQKATLEEGLTAIDAGKYKAALRPLEKIALGAKLNPDQNKMLKDTVDKLQKKIAKGEGT